MTDKQPNQATGGKDMAANGGKDSTQEPPGMSGGEQSGGQSGGGARPSNPKGGGDAGSSGGFMGHGGQSHIGYSGTGDDDGAENANAATKE